MAASAYASKDSAIEELVNFLFHDRMVAVTLVNDGRFLQLIMKPNRRKTESPFENGNTSTIFGVTIFFHSLLFYNCELQKKTLTVS